MEETFKEKLVEEVTQLEKILDELTKSLVSSEISATEWSQKILVVIEGTAMAIYFKYLKKYGKYEKL